MDNGYSLSDLRAATGDGNSWGNGAWWIIILFLFCFMGGNGWNRNTDYSQFATAASQQEILFGQQFGQLNDRITNIGNGVCNLGYEMQGNGLDVQYAQRGRQHRRTLGCGTDTALYGAARHQLRSVEVGRCDEHDVQRLLQGGTQEQRGQAGVLRRSGGGVSGRPGRAGG